MSMVPRARGTMDMGVGYNGHVYRHVGGTSCVNQHIFNSFILGIVQIKKRYIF